MSESIEISEEQKENIPILIENEDEILSMSSEIESVFEDYRESDMTDISENNVQYALRQALLTIYPEDEADEIAIALIEHIVNQDENIVKYLKSETEVGEDFIQFLVRTTSKNAYLVRSLRLRANQGEKYWSSIDSDVVLRSGGDQIGLRHRIIRQFKEDFEIDASLYSNLRLIRYLLSQQERALEEFNETGDLSEEEVEKFVETVNQFVSKYNDLTDD